MPSSGMSGDTYMEGDFYSSSAYTADISNKMRVPDRLTAHGGEPGPHHASSRNKDPHFVEDAGGHAYGMQVPDRILLNGNDQHMPSKSAPRELQLERSVMPPTPEHVRVQTPPRSIKLDDVASYPSPDDGMQAPDNFKTKPVINGYNKGSSSLEAESTLKSLDSTGDFREPALSVSDEVQMMRRQIAKLNHRLMSVELEAQQQQQREMVFTVLCSAYFLVKAVIWLNKSY